MGMRFDILTVMGHPPGCPIFLFCPIGQRFKCSGFTAVGEGQTAGEQHGRGFFGTGAVFVIAHKGEASAGKLHPDLMAASRVQTDGN